MDQGRIDVPQLPVDPDSVESALVGGQLSGAAGSGVRVAGETGCGLLGLGRELVSERRLVAWAAV